jgi:hypothetical protein
MTAVAQSVGISLSHYSRIESGHVRATPDIAATLEKHFSRAITRLQILYPDDVTIDIPIASGKSRSP